MARRFSERKKKNILDLQYSKCLQFFNTSIIILFTYLIGFAIALFARQIDYRNLKQMLLVGLISIIFLSLDVVLIQKYRISMENILQEIRRLNI